MTKNEKQHLQWMIDNDYSLSDFVKELIPYANEIATIEPHATMAYCIKEGFYDLKHSVFDDEENER